MDFELFGVVAHVQFHDRLADCNNFYASCERVFNPQAEINFGGII